MPTDTWVLLLALAAPAFYLVGILVDASGRPQVAERFDVAALCASVWVPAASLLAARFGILFDLIQPDPAEFHRGARAALFLLLFSVPSFVFAVSSLILRSRNWLAVPPS
jgi:hypothetical protein